MLEYVRKFVLWKIILESLGIVLDTSVELYKLQGWFAIFDVNLINLRAGNFVPFWGFGLLSVICYVFEDC